LPTRPRRSRARPKSSSRRTIFRLLQRSPRSVEAAATDAAVAPVADTPVEDAAPVEEAAVEEAAVEDAPLEDAPEATVEPPQDEADAAPAADPEASSPEE